MNEEKKIFDWMGNGGFLWKKGMELQHPCVLSPDKHKECDCAKCEKARAGGVKEGKHLLVVQAMKKFFGKGKK